MVIDLLGHSNKYEICNTKNYKGNIKKIINKNNISVHDYCVVKDIQAYFRCTCRQKSKTNLV